MFDRTILQKNVSSFDVSPRFDGYSKVVIIVSDEVEYTAGDDTGRTLTVDNPWGTQQLAEDILKAVKGYQYQPYEATGALINPAVELGDGITIDKTYSWVYNQDINFGPLYSADVSAPTDEEINHEFEFIPERERKVERRLNGLSSTLSVTAAEIAAEVIARKEQDEIINSKLSVQAGQIEAKVEKSSGDFKSFGWILEDDEWRIDANSSTILRATAEGLEVAGKIIATSGKIGGFDIVDNHISYNNATWGGSNSIGVYVGTEGIQLGSKGNGFTVDSYGHVTAESGEFRGTVRAGNIQYGGADGYFNGSGLAYGSVTGSQIGGSTVSTYNTTGGVNQSLGYADFANGVFNGYDTAGFVSASYGYFRFISMRGNLYAPKRTTIGGITIEYLGKVNV